MKFSWKMILLTTILLTLSLSIGGYSVVSLSFEDRLSSQMDIAQEEMRLFSTMLRAITSADQEIKSTTELKQLMQELTKTGGALSSYEFSLWDEEKQLIFQTANMHSDAVYAPQKLYASQSWISENEYIVTTLSLEICSLHCFVQRENDVSMLYLQTQENLSRYQYIMLAILAIAVAMTTLFTLVLTRPLSKISRTAKRLSSGYYDRRVNVRAKDEFGQVAKDFNDMADVLEQKIAELAEALRRQKDFTASFAHELKTPLTSVIGYADTLRSRELSAQKRFEAADYIVSEGKRLEAMSFALLDLFALERQKPDFKLCSMKRLSLEVEKSCAFMLKQKQITLRLNVEDRSLFVMPELLHNLLYNLIDNARKASDEGSNILLSGEMRPNGYLLCVTDEGRGMSQEVFPRLTEPFYMVNKSRARADGGAGLGLALCERIAALHGTQLRFESVVGRGTRVSICLGGEA